jgi:hypothetical protein
MRLVKVLPAIALVATVGCSDGPTALSAGRSAIMAAVSNPPPPPVTGAVLGDFDVPPDEGFSVARGTPAAGLSLSTSGTTLSHSFNTPATFDRSEDLTSSVITVGHGRHPTTFTADAEGHTTGSGSISETDEAGNIWTINFSQLTGGPGLGECASPPLHGECVSVGGSVSATVRILVGRDHHNRRIYRTVTSNSGTLRFEWTPTTTNSIP